MIGQALHFIECRGHAFDAGERLTGLRQHRAIAVQLQQRLQRLGCARRHSRLLAQQLGQLRRVLGRQGGVDTTDHGAADGGV